MAWMKSSSTGKFFLTGEFTQRSDIPQAEASNISDILGFSAEVVTNAAITEEKNRVAANRAALIADIAAAITVASGAFTPDDRAMLDDIASKGELTQALTSTVQLINAHTTEEVDSITLTNQ